MTPRTADCPTCRHRGWVIDDHEHGHPTPENSVPLTGCQVCDYTGFVRPLDNGPFDPMPLEPCICQTHRIDVVLSGVGKIGTAKSVSSSSVPSYLPPTATGLVDEVCDRCGFKAKDHPCELVDMGRTKIWYTGPWAGWFFHQVWNRFWRVPCFNRHNPAPARLVSPDDFPNVPSTGPNRPQPTPKPSRAFESEGP